MKIFYKIRFTKYQLTKGIVKDITKRIYIKSITYTNHLL